MWIAEQTSRTHLSHDRPCPYCGHALHTFLPCSETCRCVPTSGPCSTIAAQKPDRGAR